ncbi:MAG: NHL repeat-containing protein [Planctomycetota bacterium]|nr:NHL repeat-containing protein [Planctomycetota bacterium]
MGPLAHTLSLTLPVLLSGAFAQGSPGATDDGAVGAFAHQVEVPAGMERASFLPNGAVRVAPSGVGSGRTLIVPPLDPEQPIVEERPICTLLLDDPVSDDRVPLRIQIENVLDRPYTVEIPGGALEPLEDPVRILPLDASPHRKGFLVLERGAHRLRAIGVDGRERFRIGGKGAGPGQFNFPSDVALDAEGRIFVVDTDNHRIQRFHPDGAFDREWGGRGAFPGLLAAPSSIDIEGDRLYVTEELNHRVSVFDLNGRFLYPWGMHAVVPRQGEGRIHYPRSIDVSADGTRAVVCEPFERRIQYFTRFPGGMEEARRQAMPSKQDVSSHFGRYLAGDDDLLAMWEPESGAVAVFDMTTDTGINITVFTNHGSGWDDLARMGALHLDSDRQEFVVSDVVNDRLQLWRLDRDREASIKYDPFMARLTSAVELDALRADLASIAPDRSWVVPRIVSFTRSEAPDAPLLAADEANGVVLALDDRFRPVAVGVDCATPLELLADGEDVRLLERDDQARLRLLPLDERGSALDGEGTILEFNDATRGAALLDGVLFLGNQSGDRIDVFDRSLASSEGSAGSDRQWGQTGELDGQFYAPAGVAALDGERIVVVDQGNHRAQIFAADGSWLSTFSLSSGYTVPRNPPQVEAPAEDGALPE